MKRMMEIVCNGQEEPKWKNQVIQSLTYREAFEAAREKLNEDDRQVINRLIKDYNTSGNSDGKRVAIRNFGVAAIEELTGALGIFLTQLDDRHFEQMLQDRKARI